MEKCGVCQEPAAKRCAKCKSVSYCSAAHQKSDWKKHKNICHASEPAPSSALAIQENGHKKSDDETILQMEQSFLAPAYVLELLEDGVDHGGLYMFANRDMEPGEVIFREPPAVLCPLLLYGGKNDQNLNPCWGCFKPMWGGKGAVYRCSKCGLPVCSTICETAPIHKQCECQVIRQMKAKQKRRGMTDTAVLKQYLDVSVLRFLIYRDKHPKSWEYFANLASSSRSLVYQSHSNCGPEVLGKDGKDLKLSMMYTNNNSELVLLACRILSTFWDVITSNYGGPAVRALYCYMSCVQHDCVGNTFSIIDKNTHVLTLKAAHKISKGTLLTYDFLGNPWASSMSRRAQLLQKNIICSCLRCSDATEFGTCCSSFRCSKCESGYYLPINPDPTSPLVEEAFLWKCDQKECEDIIHYEIIDTYIEAARREYSWGKDDNPEVLRHHALNFYNNMPEKHSKLGPTHSITLEVMDDYLHADRIALELRPEYLTITPSTKFSADDLPNLRRKREFSQRLVSYFEKAKKDCVNVKKCWLYVEYGFYNLLTTALEHKLRKVGNDDVIKALHLSLDLWRKAKEMLKSLSGAIDPMMPNYNGIVEHLTTRFEVSSNTSGDELLIPFLMTELHIDWSEKKKE